MLELDGDVGIVNVFADGSGIGIEITNTDEQTGEVYCAISYLDKRQAIEIWHFLNEHLD